MKNKIIYSLIAVCTLSSSCNDAFMDRKPHTEITAENFFNTEEDLRLYCYGLINTPGYDYIGDAGTDNQATTDNVEVKNIMTSANPTSVTIASGWNWDRLYDINFFLENCERASVPEDVLKHYQGIARYYRASFWKLDSKPLITGHFLAKTLDMQFCVDLPAEKVFVDFKD